ncbi:hypothetical protein AGDE_08982 [Angomonas deanei]|nr:hypothetical protein AGDE_08982 [Angomonas deanei]|eukprot:EPY31577.1 hypothetical protein AGDE_08982 [Angomonas deanei]
MPLHRWSVTDIEKVLGYTALNPSLFGFPEKPTCVVNTAYFLPSLRSKPKGVWAFGTERGCKSIIIPGSLNQEPFDKLDASLLDPLFRWNPGVEYVYLSQYCQPMTPQLIPMLSKCHRIQHLTLEGWNDAVAIHRVVMACKNVDVIETFSLDDLPRDWKNEVSVQALATLIEMHPKMRAVMSHRLFLGDWHDATQFSRCKHNVALIPFSCDWSLLFYMLFVLALAIPCYAIYRLTEYVCKTYLKLTDAYIWFWSVFVSLGSLAGFIALDAVAQKRYGRGWINMQKYVILGKRRIDIMMNVHQTSLAKLQK